ncbi:MAG: ABC transporter ATP-binding protein [Oscillospiraceae bacterium]
MPETILEVKDLCTYFHRKDGFVKAVDGISYTLERGDTLAIVGESGSGKSVSVSSVMGLIKTGHRATVKGQVIFKGRDLFALKNSELLNVRGNEISMIFQDPMSSLNPTMKIGEQIIEPLLWHGKSSYKEAKKIGISLLEEVGIPSPEIRFNNYPFEFSGGMRQRVMIAMALICNPDLLIADEPTTALDVTVQAQILGLMQNIQKKKNTSTILITHDLAVASSFCNRVIVMYAGHIMEQGSMNDFIQNPTHPYSQGLLNSTPLLNDKRTRLDAIGGQPPNLKNMPDGCPFAPRCKQCTKICREKLPPVVEMSAGHTVSCWLYAQENNMGGAL